MILELNLKFLSREHLATLEREKLEWQKKKEEYQSMEEKKHLQVYYRVQV